MSRFILHPLSLANGDTHDRSHRRDRCVHRPENVLAFRAVIVLRPVATVLFGDVNPIARTTRRASLVERACIKRLGSLGKVGHGYRSRQVIKIESCKDYTCPQMSSSAAIAYAKLR